MGKTKTTRYLGAAQVGAEVGKTRSAITASLRRHGPKAARPFPPPRVYIGDVPGWAEEQLDDIRAWFAAPAKGRSLRSATRAAWALEHMPPGPERDQIEQFVESVKAGAPSRSTAQEQFTERMLVAFDEFERGRDHDERVAEQRRRSDYMPEDQAGASEE